MIAELWDICKGGDSGLRQPLTGDRLGYMNEPSPKYGLQLNITYPVGKYFGAPHTRLLVYPGEGLGTKKEDGQS